MKKLFWPIYIVLMLALPAYGWIMAPVIGGVESSGGSEPSWTFECLFEGSDGGGTTYTAGGGDVGFSSGTLSSSDLVDETNDLITIDAADENICITRTDGIFQSDQGAYEVRFKWTDTDAGNSDIIGFEYDSTNFFILRIIDAGTYIQMRWRGGGANLNSLQSGAGAITSGQVARIRVKYYATGDSGTDVLSIAIDNNDDGVYDSWIDTADSDAVTTWSNEPSSACIGDGSSSNGILGNAIDIYYTKWIHDYTAFD